MRSNVSALHHHARGHLWNSNAYRVLLCASDDLADQPQYVGAYYQELLDEALRYIGASHPDTLTIRDRLAKCHAEAGEFDRAVTQAKHLLAGRLHLLGADHVDTLTARHNVARWHTKAGHPSDAVAELEQLIPAQTKVFGPNNHLTPKTRLELAIARAEAGDAATAITELEQLLADQEQLSGSEHRFSIYTRAHLALVRAQAGEYVTATTEFERLIADRMRILALCESIIPTLESSITSHYDNQGNMNGWNAQRRDLMIEIAGVPYHDSYEYTLGRYDAIHGTAAYHTKYAIKELTVLLADALRVWGGDSPLTLAMQHNLARWREWARQRRSR